MKGKKLCNFGDQRWVLREKMIDCKETLTSIANTSILEEDKVSDDLGYEEKKKLQCWH